MATLASDTPPLSPRLNFRRKSWARRLERCCCQTLSYFPLSFIYGLTTWAVYVEINVSFWTSNTWTAYFTAALGIALYLLANTSYTIAVFTTPGSPLDPRQDWRDRGISISKRTPYSALPTTEHDIDDDLDAPHSTNNIPTLTAKSSTGKPRYCKKCRTTKPDRSHHCSTCGRCVLKMDHHCPWLATCVGLHNYKAFLLFLTYTSLFCWLCFLVSGTWVWTSISDAQQMQEGLKIVNAILLAVLGGIIGLVLTGFTGWHIYLAVSGQTTIESLEKTRYLSPLRRHMEPDNGRNYVGHSEASVEGGEGEQQQSLLEHLKETHANALPGILRPEEGEASRSHTPNPSFSHHPSSSPVNPSSSSPAKSSLQSSYANLEAQRERTRYLAYQDELDSAKLPNAFDLGWHLNLLHVLGNKPLFWFLPVCNTRGDGWVWEISDEWREASAEVARERAARGREEEMWAREGGRQGGLERGGERRDLRWAPGVGFVDRVPEGFYQGGHGEGGEGEGEGQMLMQPLDRRKAPPRVSSRNSGLAHVGRGSGVGGSSDDVDSYDTSSDEDVQQQQWRPNSQGTANWNDIPDDFLSAGRANRSHSRGRRKGD